MSHRLVSPQEYIASRILSYPSLYAYKDKNVAKFAVLDQLLNVNGNGIRDEEELRETLTVKNDFSVDFQRADAFCEKGVFEGYTKMLKFGPDLNSYTKGYLEEEKVLHREVLIWEQCNPLLEPYEFRTPYPNFKEN